MDWWLATSKWLARRARPSGRTKLQQEQKQETRERLLRAAEGVFAKRSYAAASVEDIILASGASRASVPIGTSTANGPSPVPCAVK